jgi:hypothetical protein
VPDELPVLRFSLDYAAELPLWGVPVSQLDLSARLLDKLVDWWQQFNANFDPHKGWSSEAIKSEWADLAVPLEMDLRVEIDSKANLLVDLWPLEVDDSES